MNPHPDSRWTHPICSDCYRVEEPGRQPAQIRPEYATAERCCFCGETTNEGIYYRKDPTVLHGTL